MIRVYFETTVFNSYLEEGREYCAETKHLFNMISTGEVEAYTSAAVISEILRSPELKREHMLKLITEYGMAVLEVEQSAYDLADTYVEVGLIPAKYRMDGVHIAVASVSGLDCIVSLNFRHINKLKTKTGTEVVNKFKGYDSLFICTPMEVTNYGK
ncbi:MAG: hypothetical protein LBS84_13000 [Clostridiales bacterium]|jgi:predicted nucleic acid-binding protein|nr:hypothetical protein [Clostridiales bacterium]